MATFDILDNSARKSHGRVNLSDGTETSSLEKYPGFSYEKTAEDNFQNDMLRGNWEKDSLSSAFFSSKNVNVIQNLIRRTVYEKSKSKGYVIDDQSVDELKIIMRAMFLQYARHSGSVSIQAQINDLNNRVVDWSVPHILSAVDHYFYYLKDIDTLPTPMALPVSLGKSGIKSNLFNPLL